jgi:hypothetical protein
MTKDEFINKVIDYEEKFGDFPTSYFGIKGEFADEVAGMIDSAIELNKPFNEKQIKLIKGDVPENAEL